MRNKTLVFSCFLIGFLGCRMSVLAGPSGQDLSMHPDHEAIAPHPESLQRAEKDLAFLLDRSDMTKDYEEIERRLKHLLQELKALEKEAEERLQKEVLPHLRREIEKLRKWLRQFRMKEDDQKPIKT